MQIAALEGCALHIPFRQEFAHAAARRRATQSILVTVRSRDGHVGLGEGCPREYVTAETVAGALAFVAAHRQEWMASIHDVAQLKGWAVRHRQLIDAAPAAWTAVELALLDLLGHTNGLPVETLLGLPSVPDRFVYTAVLGHAATASFAAQLSSYLRAGFTTFKIKLCGDLAADKAKIRALQDAGVDATAVRADANNLWTDADIATAYMKALAFPLRALEEPLRPGDFAGMRRVARALEMPIILDESLLRLEHLAQVEVDADRFIANVRISKMGGIARSLEVAAAACRRGVAIIVGAHVGETSVLARAALTLSPALAPTLIAREGAFGTHLLSRDVVTPSITFGAGGVVEAASLAIAAAPGLGLSRLDAIKSRV